MRVSPRPPSRPQVRLSPLHRGRDEIGATPETPRRTEEEEIGRGGEGGEGEEEGCAGPRRRRRRRGGRGEGEAGKGAEEEAFDRGRARYEARALHLHEGSLEVEGGRGTASCARRVREERGDVGEARTDLCRGAAGAPQGRIPVDRGGVARILRPPGIPRVGSELRPGRSDRSSKFEQRQESRGERPVRPRPPPERSEGQPFLEGIVASALLPRVALRPEIEGTEGDSEARIEGGRDALRGRR
mmetsp:Transcript_29221/g.86521  ORF Transcript_29221/g.86521 Transcript_29221/m.86521 type:complete len:243 (+) Transcript_29221:281-1009(+)